MMCNEGSLTIRTLGQRNLLDACPISTGVHLHLTLVLVQLPIRPTNWLPVVTTVPVARAALKLLLLQAAKHIVALVRLHKTCRGKISFFYRHSGCGVYVNPLGHSMSLTYPLIG